MLKIYTQVGCALYNLWGRMKIGVGWQENIKHKKYWLSNYYLPSISVSISSPSCVVLGLWIFGLITNGHSFRHKSTSCYDQGKSSKQILQIYQGLKIIIMKECYMQITKWVSKNRRGIKRFFRVIRIVPRLRSH